MLQISRECQHELTAEIADLKDKYAEVLDLLHDTQEQLRKYSKKVGLKKNNKKTRIKKHGTSREYPQNQTPTSGKELVKVMLCHM